MLIFVCIEKHHFLTTKQKRKQYIFLQAGLAISPDNHALLRILGTSLMTQGNLDEAIATYATLLKMDPNDAEALLGAGMAYKEMCRVDEAQQVGGL